MTSGALSSAKPNGLTLVLNGCEERLQIALGQPEASGKDITLLASREWTVPGQNVRFLTPGIQETLAAFEVGMEAVDRIACTRGPGSFTGMRLVLAAAAGLGVAKNIPMAGLDYLPIVASQFAGMQENPIHVLTYARRGLVYHQAFDGTATAIGSAEAMAATEAVDMIGKRGPCVLVGTGVRKNPAEVSTLPQAVTVISSEWDNPKPDTLLRIAARADYSDTPIEPLYLRASDAEDNLGFIARKRGISEQEARQRLARATGKK